jgi:hypothetical protein
MQDGSYSETKQDGLEFQILGTIWLLDFPDLSRLIPMSFLSVLSVFVDFPFWIEFLMFSFCKLYFFQKFFCKEGAHCTSCYVAVGFGFFLVLQNRTIGFIGDMRGYVHRLGYWGFIIRLILLRLSFVFYINLPIRKPNRMVLSFRNQNYCI